MVCSEAFFGVSDGFVLSEAYGKALHGLLNLNLGFDWVVRIDAFDIKNLAL